MVPLCPFPKLEDHLSCWLSVTAYSIGCIIFILYIKRLGDCIKEDELAGSVARIGK
jgi:hypothetical protein